MFKDFSAYEKIASVATEATGVEILFTGEAHYENYLQALRYKLPNGLTVILLPLYQAPIFVYQTWFKVGSKHENWSLTGRAHLFEHLMFKGTKRYPSSEFDREMERRGAETNALTSVDYTYYTESLAASWDNLKTVISFEADRLQGLVLDELTFASEKEVVKNERLLTSVDSLPGLLAEELYALAFTAHPYGSPVIGKAEDLERLTLADMQAFYHTFYAPNNATVVVAGALAPEETLISIANEYKYLAPKPLVYPQLLSEPEQRSERLKILNKEVSSPHVLLGFLAGGELEPGYAALQILVQILTNGESSRLYERLVHKEQLVSEISATLSPAVDPGLCEILASIRQEADPYQVLSIIQEELDKLREGITPRELTKAVNQLEVEFLETLKDLEGVAEILGHYETNYNNFTLGFKTLARYNKVTLAEVKEVAKETFAKTKRSTVMVL